MGNVESRGVSVLAHGRRRGNRYRKWIHCYLKPLPLPASKNRPSDRKTYSLLLSASHVHERSLRKFMLTCKTIISLLFLRPKDILWLNRRYWPSDVHMHMAVVRYVKLQSDSSHFPAKSQPRAVDTNDLLRTSNPNDSNKRWISRFFTFYLDDHNFNTRRRHCYGVHCELSCTFCSL